MKKTIRKSSLVRVIAASLAALFAATLSAGQVFAGAVGGPRSAEGVGLGGGSYHTYKVAFKGGETAHVDAVGDGDIDLYVYDEDGDLVESDDYEDGEPCVIFEPDTTAVYYIVVENAEEEAVTYDIVTN